MQLGWGEKCTYGKLRDEMRIQHYNEVISELEIYSSGCGHMWLTKMGVAWCKIFRALCMRYTLCQKS